MFVDKAVVLVKGGDGGNGIVSFRHEKFVDRGGPDGGDGGDGGDVVLVGSRNENTLATFRYQKELTAEPGTAGSKRNRHGKTGKNLQVMVPVGTVVSTEDGEVMADIADDGQEFVLAHGGKGGYGNAHFVSSRRQAPRVAEKGEPGEALTAILELKMIADVGLIGLPNAGKSTLLSSLTNARPEIANYPFTTLRPNLGVADLNKSTSVLIADIPGLIEGASKGKGLGDEFLRHVERTRVLVHLIDAYTDDLATAYKTIRHELAAYKVDLSKRPEIVAINKIDGLDDELITDRLKELKAIVPKRTPLLAISATSGQGTDKLLGTILKLIKKNTVKEKEKLTGIPLITLPTLAPAWQISQTDDGYVITGRKIERFALRTDFESPEGLRRLRDIMRKMGIMHELERRKIESGQTIKFGKTTIGTIEY
jgi:GTPase